MFPFLLIFIIFLIILTYYIKKSNASQEKVQQEFWEKERLSNAVRKKDISKLDYINIPLDKFPPLLHSQTEEKLYSLASKPMLNLTGISNTDLKLEYGTANLAVLSDYDANFTDLIALLPDYIDELLDAGHTTQAKELLEHILAYNADSRKLYQQLTQIYLASNDTDQIQKLYELSANLPEFTRLAVQKDLSAHM